MNIFAAVIFVLLLSLPTPTALAFSPVHPIFEASVSWQKNSEIREQLAEGVEASIISSSHREGKEEWRRIEYSIRREKLQTFEIWNTEGFVRSWTRILRRHEGNPWIWVHHTWCIQKIGGENYIIATHLYDEGGSIIPLK